MARSVVSLDNMLAWLRREMPDLYASLDPKRIDAWYDEAANGTGRGRTDAQIRADIVKWVVGSDRMQVWVRDQFAQRGITVATSSETADARVARIAGEIESGQRTMFNVEQTLDTQRNKAGIGSDPGPQRPGTETIGGTEIPDGMRVVRVTAPAGSDAGEQFYLVGTVNGIDTAYLVGDRERFEELFGTNYGDFDSVTAQSQDQFDNSDVIVVGEVDEIVGSTESLQAQTERDMRELGLDNPPEWIQNDPEAMGVFLIAVNEGWSPERTWGALADTQAFKDRYPGIETIMAQMGTNSYVDAVAEYQVREADIRQSLLTHRGHDTDVSPEYISDLVASGWDPADVEELVELEAQVRARPEMLKNINEILEFQGMAPLTEDEFIDYLRESNRVASGTPTTLEAQKGTNAAGSSQAEQFQAINDALRFQALLDAGVDISLEQASALGQGDTGEEILSPAQFSRQAQLAAQEIGRNRNDIDLSRYGLTDEDIIAASFDEESPSGRSKTEVQELIMKLSRERSRAETGHAGAASFQDAEGRLRVQGFGGVR